MQEEKLYYRIGEVAEMFNVNTSLIRYWESEFSVLRPRKSTKGNRMFTQRDLRYLRMIYQLVKVQGLHTDLGHHHFRIGQAHARCYAPASGLLKKAL